MSNPNGKLVRPSIVSEAHLEYLDDLREGGTINMWGAGSHLEAEFSLTRVESGITLMYWIKSFDERHSDPAQRKLAI
jgi:hypothetical protein